MSGEYISVSNGKCPVSNVKKRAKMFAVCAWMQIAVKNDHKVTPKMTAASSVITYFSKRSKNY
jgi:hypothetical protein